MLPKFCSILLLIIATSSAMPVKHKREAKSPGKELVTGLEVIQSKSEVKVEHDTLEQARMKINILKNITELAILSKELERLKNSENDVSDEAAALQTLLDISINESCSWVIANTRLSDDFKCSIDSLILLNLKLKLTDSKEGLQESLHPEKVNDKCTWLKEHVYCVENKSEKIQQLEAFLTNVPLTGCEIKCNRKTSSSGTEQ